MAKKRAKKKIEQYGHGDKQRVNNPPVGLVTPRTDPPRTAKKTYAYDPHLDPQLVWAGKAERTSFDVPTVSLHVHERIDPKTIINAVRSGSGQGLVGSGQTPRQRSLFEEPEENPPLRDALDFYKHSHGWTNRLVAGDSLLVMNSLLEKEGMAGKVQMIYIDPPYGIRYGSNFQPFVNRRDVKDGKDGDLTGEPETLKAFRDTWELGIHSYLSYLRDRLLLARELLHESGSCFVQIGDENVHRVRCELDEIFGNENFISLITVRKTGGTTGKYLSGTADFVLWYGKDTGKTKYHPLFTLKGSESGDTAAYNLIELPDGKRRRMTSDEHSIDPQRLKGERFQLTILTSPRIREGRTGYFPVTFEGKEYLPTAGEWKTHREGIQRLVAAKRVDRAGSTLRYVRYLSDFPATILTNTWVNLGGATDPIYVVQTNLELVKRCLLMTTDPGDIVLDPTCGSGTTAYVAEQWGRRWIACDTSRVAVTLAKGRLMTPVFDYYQLAHPQEGIGSGFKYKTVPHVTLKSIANNPEIQEGMTRARIDAAIKKYADQETLYDQPLVDRSTARVAGPFTVEAVPAAAFGAPEVRPIDPTQWEDQGRLPEMEDESRLQPGSAVVRQGETLRQEEWRDELLKSGVRGKGGQRIEFARLEPLPGARFLHAIGETIPEEDDSPALMVAVSFGPEHAPLEQRQVEQAWDEARTLKSRPDVLLFAAFHFDPEAAKDIDELTPEKTGMLFLKSQMNTDLLTEDLKKKRSSNESFWLMGQPDVELRAIHEGEHEGRWQVEVLGFDYYNPVNGKIESGDTSKIAMWMLDTDYDGRSLYPRQVFFPMSGAKDGWARLAKNLKAEIDPDLIEAYRGTESLPFEAGRHGRVAVKIVDDRGIESLKIISLQ